MNLRDEIIQKPIRTIKNIIEVAYDSGEYDKFVSKRKDRNAEARSIAVYLAKQHLAFVSHNDLAAVLNYKDHSAITYAMHKIHYRVQYDKYFKELVNILNEQVKNEL